MNPIQCQKHKNIILKAFITELIFTEFYLIDLRNSYAGRL